MLELSVGDRIYNHGDMANEAHNGLVDQVRTDRWGTNYRIVHENGVDTYWITPVHVSPVYLGHGGTRIVKLDEYKRFRRERLAQLGVAVSLSC
jgi:hypothetical protein